MNEEGLAAIFGTLIFLGVMLLIGGALSITIIPEGSLGLVLRFGALQDGILKPGLHFMNPITTSVTKIDVRTKLWIEESSAGTTDMQAVSVKSALNYHVDSSKVKKVFTLYGKDYESLIVSPLIDEVVKSVTAQYTAEELLQKRSEVKLNITSAIEDKLSEFHIIVDEYSLNDVQFSAEFDEAIEQKQVAQQEALKAEQELLRIEIEAQQQVVRAQAQADSVLSMATAQATANELLTESLTKEIIQKTWIEAWNGILPVYMLGDDSSLLMNIN